MTTTTKHRHRTKTSRTICFGGPIDGARPNPAAHGNICVIDICACGATRAANVNGQYVEQGTWR